METACTCMLSASTNGVHQKVEYMILKNIFDALSLKRLKVSDMSN